MIIKAAHLVELSLGHSQVADQGREEKEDGHQEAEERAPDGLGPEREHDDVGHAGEDSAEGLSGENAAHVLRGKATGHSE